VNEANRVASKCYEAATKLTEYHMREAKRMEDEFEKRYGDNWRKFATLNYKDWVVSHER